MHRSAIHRAGLLSVRFAMKVVVVRVSRFERWLMLKRTIGSSAGRSEIGECIRCFNIASIFRVPTYCPKPHLSDSWPIANCRLLQHEASFTEVQNLGMTRLYICIFAGALGASQTGANQLGGWNPPHPALLLARNFLKILILNSSHSR